MSSQLGDKRFIQKICLRNFLSFGPKSEEFEMKSLNVLIGPNASGKSNFIEAFYFLKSLPERLNTVLREQNENSKAILSALLPYLQTLNKPTSDSLRQNIEKFSEEIVENAVDEWFWKGDKAKNIYRSHLELDVIFASPDFKGAENNPLRHQINLGRGGDGKHFFLKKEFIGYLEEPARNFYLQLDEKGERRQGKNATQSVSGGADRDRSLLSKWGKGEPETAFIIDGYSKLAIHRETTFGRSNPLRRPQSILLQGNYLMENGDNLALIINNLRNDEEAFEKVLTGLKNFYEPVQNIVTRVDQGVVKVFLKEKGLNTPTPASRLSDGTLRYLCLLTILCHPEPPPLICIEEPELGLHPDIISSLAKFLIDASSRTQLVVTTHSRTLIDAFSDTPEAVVVCDKKNGSTTLNRLDRKDLDSWLDEYSLGEAWLSGAFGGTRW